MDAARRVRLSGLLCVPILALIVSAAAALPGDLDSSFNGTGTRSFHYGGGGSDNALTALIQTGGKIILSGAGEQPGNSEQDAVVSRLNPNGSTDSTFGPSGTGATSLDFGNPFSGGEAALAPDGKIVVAGTVSSNNGSTFTTVAARLNADGTPDTSFGPGGERELLPGGGTPGVAVQSTGKPVIVADNGGAWAVSRLTTGGTFDPSFGTSSGQTIVPVAGPLAGIALQPDDKIIVAGSRKAGSAFAMVVARLNADGTPDPSFDGGNPLAIGPGFAHAVTVQPDHRIVVVGDSVFRLNPDGSPDTSFGNGGTEGISFAPGPSAEANAVAIQPDGKILVAGDEGDDFGAERLQPGGALDTTFSSDGKQTVDFGGDASVANSVALEPDGSVVLAGGKAPGAVAVARLQGDAGSATGGGGFGGGGGNGSPPRCAGKRATIVGTSRADHLRGTSHADVIAGLGGNDKIRGLGGNDIICGGSGNDTVSGGSGKDKLYGQAGKDSLSGGAGNDLLSGGAGRDKLTGGSGRDSLNGGSGKDRCSGHDRKKSC